MSFYDTVMYCASRTDFVIEFDRLSGTNLSLRGSPLELMIDKTTGKLDDDLAKFVNFVHKYIYKVVGHD